MNDLVVFVTTNKDGSVNALNLKVQGLMEGVPGPQGRNGYIHINDALTLHRTQNITEVAVRTSDIGDATAIKNALSPLMPDHDVNTWNELTPFSLVASVIDLMFVALLVLLISIIVISIMNVMMMAVYERTKEIGTLAAIGTKPKHIMYMFYTESTLLGLISAGIGTTIGLILIFILKLIKPTFMFNTIIIRLLPTVTLTQVILIIFIVVFFTVVATIIPARRAKKLEPVDALRFN